MHHLCLWIQVKNRWPTETPPTWIDLNGNSMPYPGHVYSSLVTLLSSKRNRCDLGSKRRFLFLNESMLLDAEYTSSNQTMSKSLLRRLATESSTKIIRFKVHLLIWLRLALGDKAGSKKQGGGIKWSWSNKFNLQMPSMQTITQYTVSAHLHKANKHTHTTYRHTYLRLQHQHNDMPATLPLVG